MTTDPAALRRRMIDEMSKALDELWADRCREYLSTKLLNAMAEAALTAQAALLKELGLKVTEPEPDVDEVSADKLVAYEQVHEMLPTTPWDSAEK